MKKVIYCMFMLLMLVMVSGCENNNQDNNQKPAITQTKWNQLLDVSYSDYAVDIKYKGRNDTDYTYYHVEVESTIAGEKVFIQTDTETTYMESFSSQYYKIVNNEGIPCEEFANPFFEYLLELKDLYEDWNGLIDEKGWIELDDPLPGCQHDTFIPIRVKGRDTGKPEWGKFETLEDGRWVAYSPAEAAKK